MDANHSARLSMTWSPTHPRAGEHVTNPSRQGYTPPPAPAKVITPALSQPPYLNKMRTFNIHKKAQKGSY